MLALSVTAAAPTSCVAANDVRIGNPSVLSYEGAVRGNRGTRESRYNTSCLAFSGWAAFLRSQDATEQDLKRSRMLRRKAVVRCADAQGVETGHRNRAQPVLVVRNLMERPVMPVMLTAQAGVSITTARQMAYLSVLIRNGNGCIERLPETRFPLSQSAPRGGLERTAIRIIGPGSPVKSLGAVHRHSAP